MVILILIGTCFGNGKDAALMAYEAKDYAQALRLYEQRGEASGQPEGDRFYQMGHCSYRLGDRSRALLYYVKAQRHQPRNQELAFNIRLIEDELDVRDETGANDELDSIFNRFTTRELLIGALILSCLALVGWVHLPRGHGGRPPLPWVLVLGSLLATEVIYRCHFKAATGIVLSTETALRGEPHSQTESFSVLSAGMRVRVEAQSETWARVRTPRGQGWVDRNAVGIVEE